MVGRKPVRFLLQESRVFLSLPIRNADNLRSHPSKGKTKPGAASRDGQERHWALPVAEIEQPKIV